MNMKHKTNLVWMDLEMSGLEPEDCEVLEIATIITDADLNILATGPELVIHHPDSVLDAMDEWNQEHHGKSGLIQRVKDSKISLAEAEKQTLDFIKEWTEERSAPLCGNSIGQDRRFLYKYMPELSEWLHYRNIDVSTLKELAHRWRPDLQDYKKSEQHRALADIEESIAELLWYKDHFLKLNA
jgi:oligoribonuclease